jgi:Rrf2 family protein
MLLNRATDYGMRVMVDLASQPVATKAVAGEIAERQQIRPAFLSKVLVRLSQANLVRTCRGATGGAHLARPPEKINLLEVVEAMQGAIVLNDCNIEYPPCPLKETCRMTPIWREAKDNLEGLLRRTTLVNVHRAA